MKRAAIFSLLGPVLLVVCVIVIILPAAGFAAGEKVRFDLEVDSYLALWAALMVGGLALALADWIAELVDLRPWLTGAMGCVLGALLLGAGFEMPVWWWFIVKGIVVGIPALICSWICKR